jgi:hypothetical protein
LYPFQPVAIFVRPLKEPLPLPLLRYRLPLVSRATRSFLPSPVMSPTPTIAL